MRCDAGESPAAPGDGAPRRPLRWEPALRPGAGGGRAATGTPSVRCPTRSRTSSSPASTACRVLDRQLLRRMSVLGQSFSAQLLADVVEDVPRPRRSRRGHDSSRSSSTMPPGTWRSATRSSATAPTTGSRSASAASCTPGPATPSPACAGGGWRRSVRPALLPLPARPALARGVVVLAAGGGAGQGPVCQRRSGGVLRAGDHRGPTVARARRRRTSPERTRGWATPGT